VITLDGGAVEAVNGAGGVARSEEYPRFFNRSHDLTDEEIGPSTQ
jgi:hypothetical protein